MILNIKNLNDCACDCHISSCLHVIPCCDRTYEKVYNMDDVQGCHIQDEPSRVLELYPNTIYCAVVCEQNYEKARKLIWKLLWEKIDLVHKGQHPSIVFNETDLFIKNMFRIQDPEIISAILFGLQRANINDLRAREACRAHLKYALLGEKWGQSLFDSYSGEKNFK